MYVEELTVLEDGTEKQLETRQTADDALYNAAHGVMRPLPCFTQRQLMDMDWAWFIGQYPATR